MRRSTHRRNFRPTPRGRRRGLSTRVREEGAAALALVLGIIILLTTGAGILVSNVIQHDPLVQADLVQHYAYRALQAGVNTYLASVNNNPNLINCNHASTNSGQCLKQDYLNWQAVENTTSTGTVPEYYLWGDPKFLTDAKGNLTYVQVPVFGAAGTGTGILYQESIVNLQSLNGFLLRIWFSNYEATDPLDAGFPQDPGGNPPQYCGYDYANGYKGPNLPPYNYCNAVYFGPNDQVYGPIFSNDSIYVSGDPTLGPVETGDPNCLFVTGTDPSNPNNCVTATKTAGVVKQTAADLAASGSTAVKKIPITNGALPTFAQVAGCIYQGPTTITFDANDMMSVWSPDTSTPDKNQAGLSCYAGAGAQVQVPNGSYGNGVIYVANDTGACVPGANPYEDWKNGSYGPKAQIKNGAGNYDGWTAAPDCEGDAFVSDNPGLANNAPLPSAPGGISGQLTVATDNDVIVTGNLQYTDCQPTFDSTHLNPCQYSSTGNNDVLGLIATNYVAVNHPVDPNNTGALLAPCGAGAKGVLGFPTAAVCDPSNQKGTSNLVIDSAVLALHHSFAVNNYNVGSPEGTLTVYGAIAQNFRGAVGTFSGNSISTGYAKDYDWDNRIAYVAPPYYLTPGTASWGLVSSATILSPTPPSAAP